MVGGPALGDAAVYAAVYMPDSKDHDPRDGSAGSSRRRESVRASVRVLAIIVALVALLLTSSALNFVTTVRAAGEEPMKAVVVVGPTHSLTTRYLGYGRAMADAAEAQGMDVRRIFHPYATKKRVKKHAQGADLFIYVGHGNGWPSPFPPFQEATKNGLGLNPMEGDRTTSRVRYFGADWLKEKIQLAPDAVVILSHLSYASGNASSGMPIPTRKVAVGRIDNFANGFLAIGARAVWALGWQPGADVIDALHEEEATMDAIFTTSYREGINPLNGWMGEDPGYYDSVRTAGAEIHIDPSARYGYLRALSGDLAFSTNEWRSDADLPQDTVPPVLTNVNVKQSDVTVANDDGLSDTITVGHSLSEGAYLDIRVTKDGKLVRRWTRYARTGHSSTPWNGRRDDGEFVGEGKFRITLAPRDRAGNVGEAKFVRVMVLASLKAPSVSPALFDPTDEDGLAQSTRFKARLTRPATVRWLIRDAAGAVVRHGIDDVDYEAGPVKWVWDGRDDAGALLPRGEYTSRVRVSRPAGTYGHDVTVLMQPFRLRTVRDTIKRGSSMKATIRTAEPMNGKPVVTVKQRGVRAYEIKVKRRNSQKFTVTLKALKSGKIGRLSVLVSGTDVDGGSQAQRFRLTVR